MEHTYTRTSPLHVPLHIWVQFTAGIVALGLGIALMVQAQIGLGPWDVLHQGVSLLTGMAIGTASIVVGLFIMLLWIPLGQRPGVGTLLNTIFVGTLVNVFMAIFPPLTEQMFALPMLYLVQVAQMSAGIVILGIGVGLYISAGLGTGPRDGVMMGLVEKTGLSIRVMRTIMELTALTAGWLLGGTVGIGTLMFALGIGPVIQQTLNMIKQRRGVAQLSGDGDIQL